MTTTKSPTPPEPGSRDSQPQQRKKISTHWLYVAVIVAVVAGTAVGLIFGKSAAGLAVHRDRVRQSDQDDDRPDHLLHDRVWASGRSGRPRRSARSAASRCCTSS